MHDFDHPSEEALERFLLNATEGVELVRVEGHILGCEACILRLEHMEIEVEATKRALERWCRREMETLGPGKPQPDRAFRPAAE